VPTSTSRLAFADAYECMERALKDEFGIRVRFETEGHALNFRTRLNAARNIDRRDNGRIYPDTHPMHGVSEYDKVSARIREVDGCWYIYLVPILGADSLEIEALTSAEIPPLPRTSADYHLAYNGDKLELESEPPVQKPTVSFRR
jgi:hypothetical protein